ncbi:MAG TPA: S24/S26 family peptidase [Acidobacteriota bacterium]|nr:S24/S26 family peptidase [Acidobacteriota bacterium]
MRIQSKTKVRSTAELTLASPEILKLAQAELTRHRTFRMRLSGNTMRPTIHNGDWITIEPIKPGTLKAGDIVLLVTSSETAMIHRLIRLDFTKDSPYVLTRGDSTEYFDVPVPLSHVLGRISHIEHNGQKTDLTTFWQRVRTRLLGLKMRWQLRRTVFSAPK